MTLYQRLHAALHPRPATAGTAGGVDVGGAAGASVQYLRTSREAVLGWVGGFPSELASGTPS